MPPEVMDCFAAFAMTMFFHVNRSKTMNTLTQLALGRIGRPKVQATPCAQRRTVSNQARTAVRATKARQ